MSTDPVPAPDGGREPLPEPASATPRSGRQLLRALVSALPAIVPAALIGAVIVILIRASHFTIFPGFFSSDWNPTLKPASWGVGIFVVGSFLTAIPAIALAMLIGLGLGIATTSYLPPAISRIMDPFVDLLAGIPSVVYGIWGILIVGPYFGLVLNPWLADHLHLLPGFAGGPGSQTGAGLPIAVFLLTLMALPITCLLIRDALRSVPKDLWESGLALGATRWEVTRRVAIPYGYRGILSAGFLGFGRAFGETVAVAMTIGSVVSYPSNFFGVTYTMSAFIFETTDGAFSTPGLLELLAELGLLLLAISLVVNLVGRRLIAGLVTNEIPGL